MDTQNVPVLKALHLESSHYPENIISSLEKIISVTKCPSARQDDLYNELERNQYDIIFARLGLSIDSRCLNLQPSLKYIVSPTTGLNHIDTDMAERKGVRVISLKGEADFLSQVKSTAEHTWCLLLALARNLVPSMKDTINGNWDRLSFLSDELDGGTIGIIGFGRLGKIVAGYAKAFSMKILVNDINPSQYTQDDGIISASIEELLIRSDYVLLMLSFSTENRCFMDKAKFGLMKRGSYFVNTSRGELINEDDLLDALISRKLKGAALDVLTDDSTWDGKVQKTNKLITYAQTHSNLIITPHMGGVGRASMEKTRAFVTQKLIAEISSKYF